MNNHTPLHTALDRAHTLILAVKCWQSIPSAANSTALTEAMNNLFQALDEAGDTEDYIIRERAELQELTIILDNKMEGCIRPYMSGCRATIGGLLGDANMDEMIAIIDPPRS
ncbi:hypothetical protein [Magnetococcus sp. PR-3]|uniref:hypothetical protein n=1 Tax=Magnetococcus sp. PR-3 TaxID=3120355 RepID=UPI002FCE06DC